MKKILLAYYPLKVHYNHGVFLLSSILKEKGIEVFIIELGQLTDIQRIVKDNKIDFIGFSIVTGQEYNVCLPFMYEAKKTGIPVLAGGVYVRRGSYIDPTAVDYVCRGEGEILADFILEGKTDIFDKPYLHKNLDDLPLPDYGMFTGYEFDREIPFLKGIRIFPYHSSRGCPYPCSFCEVRYQPKKIRFKTTIRRDLELMAERYHPDLFHIMDELLPYYNQEWRDLFKGNRNPFMGYIRADITKDQLEFLVVNGLKVAILGIENGDEKYRNEILKKNLLDKDIYQTIGILRALRIPYVPFYMIGGPYETKEIRDKTIGMARGLGGFPVVWKYEDLSKRIFSIDEDKIKKYAEKVKGSLQTIKASINDASAYVYNEKDGFIVYEFNDEMMFIRDFGVSLPTTLSVKTKSKTYWQDKIEELCKEYGKSRYMGRMNKEYMGFQKEFNLKTYGHLIGKEV